MAFTISELSLLTSGSGADSTQAEEGFHYRLFGVTQIHTHDSWNIFGKSLTFALHLQLLVEINGPLFSATGQKSTHEHRSGTAGVWRPPQRQLGLTRPPLHSQLLHLVSLATGVRAPLKLNDFWVQSHDLIIQVTHFCHLEDTAGTVRSATNTHTYI